MKLNISMLVYLNTCISIIQYIFVKCYLKFVVLISSEDLVTDISPPYNLHTELLFFKYYFLIFLLKCYFFSLPHYAVIVLMLILLLFQDTASVNLTIGGSLGHKLSIVQPLLSTCFVSLVGSD